MFLCLKTSPCPSNYCCKAVERHQYRSHSPAFLHRELGFRSMSRWIVRPRIFFASHTCAPFWIFRSRSQYTCTGHLGPIRGVFCLGSLKLPPKRVPPIHRRRIVIRLCLPDRGEDLGPLVASSVIT
uniref:Uncharacterized protein n=1 Tax=Toxoplasma gondii COUG TaxID=1074873 RepID=A0A2G8Y332_TOXGO|nr:hypothetical protein TGCOUG_320105 [Toxoplasma gondii COUG]